jgi:ribonuclease inhibitor
MKRAREKATTVMLDASLTDVAAVRDRLVSALDLPAWTGRNLDALWDVLSTDAKGPIRIVWKDHRRAATVLGPDYRRLVTLFHDLAAARRDVTFKLA